MHLNCRQRANLDGSSPECKQSFVCLSLSLSLFIKSFMVQTCFFLFRLEHNLHQPLLLAKVLDVAVENVFFPCQHTSLVAS